MSDKLDYQKRAVDCAARAATAINDQAREVWREMEKYWRRRADGHDTPLVPEQPSKMDLADGLARKSRQKAVD
jgi:hypothetical protein